MAGKLHKSILVLISLSCLGSSAKASLNGNITSYTTTPFTKEELKQLQETQISAILQNKLQNNLDSIILSTTGFQPERALREASEFKRKFFRVSHWNIERGYQIELINKALKNTEEFFTKDAFEEISAVENINDKLLIEQQINVLKETDVFTLNEVDLGIQRTDYKNIAEEFAKSTGAAYYAFVPEFIEIDKRLIDDPLIDISKYRGLHGNAIVSKYPIKAIRFLRLPTCYDWHAKELENLVLFEKTRRQTSKSIIDEEIITELRRGDRVALIADIDLPGESTDVTVVSVHLENRCLPKCREEQMKAILGSLKENKNPVIIGGDFNNFEKSAEPTTLIKIVRRTVSDPQNLLRATITYFNPYSLMINPGLFVINSVRKYKDPTTTGIPIILRNKSKKLFSMIKDFKFTDKNKFDFSGDEEFSYGQRHGRLSNSNQRGVKGFIETYHFRRSFGIAEFKIDWLFFKPLDKRFTPAFGKTLEEFNHSPKEHMFSDHNPISAIVLI